MTEDGDRLDPKVLARYEVPAPSPDLTDRFVARLGEREKPRRLWPVLAAAGALAAAIALFVLWPTGRAVATGALSPAERTSTQLGSRGVAVAEAGARLRWTIDRDARVEQDAGDVFYRVEPGGAFVVATPAGDVTVTGTCFRVEVALTVTVTVYEGSVELANSHGRITLAAGEHGTATTTTAPSGTAITAVDARLAEQNARIVALEAKLQQLSGSGSATGPIAVGDVQPTRRPFDMTQAELGKLAAECRLPFDVPPTAGSTLMEKILEDGMREAQLSEVERAAVKRLIRDLQPAYHNVLANYYADLTGAETDDLDPATFVIEIEQKSPADQLAAAYKKLSAERAGQQVARGDSVIERYLRYALKVTDDFEQKLADEIGAARARAFRRTWGVVDFRPDCNQGHP